MKVTVIKDDEKKGSSIVVSVIMLVLGIILFFKAQQFVATIFDIMGVFIILFGIYKFNYYLKMKNQYKIEDTACLISSICSIVIGILIILLSSVLSNAIQIVSGIWLLFIGIIKLNNSVYFKDVDKKMFLVNIISSVIFFLLGLYTIFANNVIFMIIGCFLIICSIYDIISYFRK